MYGFAFEVGLTVLRSLSPNNSKSIVTHGRQPHRSQEVHDLKHTSDLREVPLCCPLHDRSPNARLLHTEIPFSVFSLELLEVVADYRGCFLMTVALVIWPRAPASTPVGTRTLPGEILRRHVLSPENDTRCGKLSRSFRREVMAGKQLESRLTLYPRRPVHGANFRNVLPDRPCSVLRPQHPTDVFHRPTLGLLSRYI